MIVSAFVDQLPKLDFVGSTRSPARRLGLVLAAL